MGLNEVPGNKKHVFLCWRPKRVLQLKLRLLQKHKNLRSSHVFMARPQLNNKLSLFLSYTFKICEFLRHCYFDIVYSLSHIKTVFLNQTFLLHFISFIPPSITLKMYLEINHLQLTIFNCHVNIRRWLSKNDVTVNSLTCLKTSFSGRRSTWFEWAGDYWECLQ